MGSFAVRALPAVAASVFVLAFTGTAQAKPDCGWALLNDWRDGRIDGTYPVGCYQAALTELPEDLRIYSSAESDIKRALLHRVAAADAGKKAAQVRSQGGQGVSTVLVLAIAAVVLAAVGSALAFVR